MLHVPHRLDFGTLFRHLYAPLTVSLVQVSAQDLYVRKNTFARRASDTLTRSFARYKFVTYFLSFSLCCWLHNSAESNGDQTFSRRR